MSNWADEQATALINRHPYDERSRLRNDIIDALDAAYAKGQAWQRERDAGIAESHFGSEPITDEVRERHWDNNALHIAKEIRASSATDNYAPINIHGADGMNDEQIIAEMRRLLAGLISNACEAERKKSDEDILKGEE